MPPFLLPDIYLLVGCLGGLLLLQAWRARRRAARRRAAVRQVILPDFASAHLQNSRDLFVFLPAKASNIAGTANPTEPIAISKFTCGKLKRGYGEYARLD